MTASLPPEVSPTEPSANIDREMLHRARRGDDSAFAQLVQRYDPALRTLVFKQLKRADLMDRVLSSAYLKAYRKLPALPEDTEPGGWLTALAAKACAEELRREAQRRTQPRRREQSAPEGETPVDVSSRLDVLREAGTEEPLPKLTPKPVDEVEAEAEAQASANEAAGAGDQADGAEADAEPEVDEGPIETPDHARGFWNALGRQLMAEREIPARPAPPISSRPEPDQDLSMGRRRRVKARDRDGVPQAPVTVEGLAKRSQAERPGLSFLKRSLIGLVVVVAAVGLGFLAYRIGGNAKPINRTGTTAPALAAQVEHTLYKSQSIAATFTHTEIAANGTRASTIWDMTSSVNGSFRMHATNVADDISYDATTGIRMERKLPDGTPQSAIQTEADGLATGPPDPNSSIDGFFDGDLAAVLRAMRAQSDVLATSASLGGRAMWSVTVSLDGGNGIPDEATLLVDQQLLTPADLLFRVSGKPVREYRLDNVSLDATIAPNTFTVSFGTGSVTRTDDGFQRVDLADIPKAATQYPLFTPTWLPDNFSLEEVAVHAGPGAHSGPTGANPVSEDVVSLTYRRDWERITVTTRRNTASPGVSWSDPFAIGNPLPTSHGLRIDGGPFRLVDARRVVEPGYVPHLWGVTKDVVFTVSGDLTADELQRVAASLH